MRNRFLALTTAVALLFGVSCFNYDVDLTAIAVTENDEVTTTTKPATTTTTTTKATTTTTAHVHTWVDVTETKVIHHDAEYATRRIWLYGDACQKAMPMSYITTPENSTHLSYWDGKWPTEYEILMSWYGSFENIPDEYIMQWITKDNCGDYGLTVDELPDYANSHVKSNGKNVTPGGKEFDRFNPEYDVIILIDWRAFIDACGGLAEKYGDYGWNDQGILYGNDEEAFIPVCADPILVGGAWDETVTTVVGHKCSTCGATDYVMGDINGDEEFNVADVVLLQKWLLAVPDIKIENWEMANLCRDDRLDVLDLCLMKRMLLNS